MACPDGGGWDINPSLLGSFKETALSLTLNSEHCQHKDNHGDTRTFFFRLSNLRFALPLPRRAVFGISVNKRFDMDFDMVGIPGTVDTIEYTRAITGRGGIYSTSVSLAGPIGDHVHLGGTFNFLSGSGVEEWTTEFANPDIRTSLDSLTHEFSGGNWTLGVLAKPGAGFSFGFSFVSPTDLRGDLELIYPGGSQLEEREYTLPPTYAGGVAYTARKRFLIASDLMVYPWSDLSVDGKPSDEFSNTYSFAIGAQILPSPDELAPLWQKIPMRIGYSRSPWYFEIGGERIEEQSLAIGSSISLRSGKIDLSVEVGERKGGDLRETVFRGGMTLSGWERW